MIIEVDRISYWMDSSMWRRLESSSPPKLNRGVAVFKPTICQLRKRNSGSGSFSSCVHLSLPLRVSTETTLDVKPPYSTKNGLVKTFMVWTLSIGMVAPNWPVAGSVAVSESISNVLRCSPLPAMLNSPFGNRRMAAASGSASSTEAGRSRRFLISSLFIETGVERLCWSGVSARLQL